MTDAPQINPAIGAMLKSARDWLLTEHALFQTLDLKPLLIGRNKATFSVFLPDDFCDADGNITAIVEHNDCTSEQLKIKETTLPPLYYRAAIRSQ